MNEIMECNADEVFWGSFYSGGEAGRLALVKDMPLGRQQNGFLTSALSNFGTIVSRDLPSLVPGY